MRSRRGSPRAWSVTVTTSDRRAMPSPPRSPRISIIVPHYDDLPALDLCLASLIGQHGFDGGAEIIVCDNASPLDYQRIVDTIGSRALLVIEREKGAGPARNRAVIEARGQILAFIDSDCIANPDWLANGIAALARGDIVGGRIDVFSTAANPTGADLFEQVFAFDQRSYVETKGFSVTANLFCRRETFAAVGGFANGVSEDLEWCHRARRKGFTLIYEDSAAVRHPTRADWAALKHKWRRLTHEAFLLSRMEKRGTLAWSLRQIGVAASAAPHSLRVVAAGLSPSETLRALGALWRIRAWRALEGLRLAWRGPD